MRPPPPKIKPTIAATDAGKETPKGWLEAMKAKLVENRVVVAAVLAGSVALGSLGLGALAEGEKGGDEAGEVNDTKETENNGGETWTGDIDLGGQPAEQTEESKESKERKEGISGTEFMENYKNIEGDNKNDLIRKRQKYVLEMVAQQNYPASFQLTPIEFTGRSGRKAKFMASRQALRIGNSKDYVEAPPLDGPHALAAAQLRGLTLPTQFMSLKIFEEALKRQEMTPEERKGQPGGRIVQYYAARRLADENNIKWDNNNPSGEWLMSVKFVETRNQLLHAWLKANDVQDTDLIAGYYKDIILPVPKGYTNGTNNQYVEIYGGFYGRGVSQDPCIQNADGSLGDGCLLEVGRWPSDKKKQAEEQSNGLNNCNGWVCIQPPSGRHHVINYFDYSHGVRFVTPWIEVDGKKISLKEFFESDEYLREFSTLQTGMLDDPYHLPADIANFVREHKVKH